MRARHQTLVAVWLVLAATGPIWGQNVITTGAGNGRRFRHEGQRALDAALGGMAGVAVGRDGTVYASDVINHLVYRITVSGVITVVAGNNIAGYSGDGGPAVNASLNSPFGISLDSQGNLYIADRNNVRIRKVTPDGTITTVAGTGVAGFSGDGGAATAARLLGAGDVALDRAGNLYIMDNRRVRKVGTDGIITTVAGNGTDGFSGDGGPATAAAMRFGTGLDVDGDGNIYIAERDNHRVRKVSGGIITTVAGNGQSEVITGDGGPATSASVPSPQDVSVAADGSLYITNSTPNAGSFVRRIAPNGVISTLAGVSSGTGTAIFAGELYVALGNGRVSKVDSAGREVFVAGMGLTNLAGDGGPAIDALLSIPHDVGVDASGTLYIVDFGNARIRRVRSDGRMEAFAGNGSFGSPGPIPENVPATTVRLQPYGIGLDQAGNVLIADGGNYRVRRVSPQGIITTVAGSGAVGYSGDGGPATNAALSLVQDVAVDNAGNIYIADTFNHRVRKVGTDGMITTVAGNGTTGFSGDGGPAVGASVAQPFGVVVDSSGALYISGDDRIRKVTANGMIQTIAGGGTRPLGDGIPATSVNSLRGPQRLSLDKAGNLYCALRDGNGVIRVTPGGTLQVIAGKGPNGFGGDGGRAADALLSLARGVDVDTAGNVYIAEGGNDRVRKVLANAPGYSASPELLRFLAPANSVGIAAQSIFIAADVAGLGFTADATTQTGGRWLTIAPPGGNAPAVIQVSVNVDGLAPGSYEGAVTITAPNGTPNIRTVRVMLTVEPEGAPRLEVTSGPLAFSLNREASPASATVIVGNRGGGSLDFAAAASTGTGGPWLTVSPASGTLAGGASTTAAVTANPSGLSPGTYLGQVVIQRTGTAQSVTIPVSLLVSNTRQSILLSQTGLTFTAVAGGGTPPPQNFGVLNTRQGVMNWTVSTSTLDGGNWLTAGPSSGASEADSLKVPLVDVGVSAAGLEPGDYYGQVRVMAAGADNSPQTVFVVLRVLPAGSNPGPIVRPTGLIFTARAGAGPPGSQTVAVSNITGGPLSYASGRLTFDGQNWLVSTPGNESVRPGQPSRIALQTDTTGLPAGIRHGALTLLFNDGSNQTVNILSVLVADPGGRNLTGECVATKLLPLFTVPGQKFAVAAGWPAAVEVRVVDDCGNAMETGTVTASFSNGDPPLALARLGEGRWSGSWQPRAPAGSGVTVTVTAQIAGQRIQGTVQVTGAVQANAQVPVIAESAVVNAASFGPRAVASPGGILSIYGTRLADRTAAAASLPLPNQLGGASVTLGGLALPMLYASEGQLNAIVPYEIGANARHQLVVRRGSTYSVPEAVTVALTQPAIFTTDSSGRGQGSIYTPDFALVDSRNPASAGDTVVLYATGLGEVNPGVRSGAAAPSAPLSRVVSTVQGIVGGVPAEVSFAGLAPGFAGVYQVNLRIPTGVAPGAAVPLTLIQNGAGSNSVTLAVR